MASILLATASADTLQTWDFVNDQGQHATVSVASDGSFSGSGWKGNAPGCGSYNIIIKNGMMSGSSITFQISASYCNGGSITGTGSGTLNMAFPSGSSGSGSVTGSISDPLGNRGYSFGWTATKTADGGGSFGAGGLGEILGSLREAASLLAFIFGGFALAVFFIPAPVLRKGEYKAESETSWETGVPATTITGGGIPTQGMGINNEPPPPPPPPTPPYGKEFPPRGTLKIEDSPTCRHCRNHTWPDNKVDPPAGAWWCNNCKKHPWRNR